MPAAVRIRPATFSFAAFDSRLTRFIASPRSGATPHRFITCLRPARTGLRQAAGSRSSRRPPPYAADATGRIGSERTLSDGTLQISRVAATRPVVDKEAHSATGAERTCDQAANSRWPFPQFVLKSGRRAPTESHSESHARPASRSRTGLVSPGQPAHP